MNRNRKLHGRGNQRVCLRNPEAGGGRQCIAGNIPSHRQSRGYYETKCQKADGGRFREGNS